MFYNNNQLYSSPMFSNGGEGMFTKLTLKGPFITYGEMGTAGQVLTAQGGSVPPRWENAGSGSNGIYGGSGDILGTTVATLDSGADFAIAYSDNNYGFYINDTTGAAKLYNKGSNNEVGVSTSEAYMTSDGGTFLFSLSSSAATLEDTSVSPKGIQYAADYSATYVNRSLVDKEYVDSVASPLPSFTAGSVIFSDGATLAQDNANFFWDDSNNRLGLGTTTPDRLLHAESADAVTNAVTFPCKFSHITSGTAATSFGIGVEYELENASGTNRIAGTEEFHWTDAVNATEDATYTLRLIRAGTLSSALTVNSAGLLSAVSSVYSGSDFRMSLSGKLYWSTRSALLSPSNGIITLYNDANTDFTRLQFGGQSASYPSIKKNNATLIIRLADDSADASLFAKDISSSGRLMPAKGADVAAANDLTLGGDGNVFHIGTGALTINAITTTGWTSGSIIILIFDDSVVVKHNTAGGGGTASMLLAGAVDFSATVSDTLMLVYDGTRWYEVSRSVN